MGSTDKGRAGHQITQVQQLAAALLATRAAYQRDGHVYLRGAHAVTGTRPDPFAGARPGRRGEDLGFPHYAYQAAMVQAATSVTPFARGHLHVGTAHRDGAKMAKSIAPLTLVTDLLRDHTPAVVRLLVLNRPSHRPSEYRPAELDQAADLESLAPPPADPPPHPPPPTPK